ncbi:MAG: hypothetical protein H3C34_21290 [Caldilineaceae bacterium]|nr:hypothetical protein [Caldilineaceae bacterium]
MIRLNVFSNPKVLIAIIVVLVALFACSRTASQAYRPNLGAGWIQQLRRTAPVEMDQVRVDAGAPGGCRLDTVQRQLLLPAGQSCRFVIDRAPDSFIPVTRRINMTLITGTVSAPVQIQLLYDEQPLNTEETLEPAQGVAVEIPQNGGSLAFAGCANGEGEAAGCVVAIGKQ